MVIWPPDDMESILRNMSQVEPKSKIWKSLKFWPLFLLHIRPSTGKNFQFFKKRKMSVLSFYHTFIFRSPWPSSSNPTFAYFYIVLSHYSIFPTEIRHLYFSLSFFHHNFLDLSCPFNWHKQTLSVMKLL